MDKNWYMVSENVRKFLPKKIKLYTTYGSHIYALSDVTSENNIIRIFYFFNTLEETGGDVVADGDPDTLSFDVHVVTENNQVKLNIDVSYGDSKFYEFTIEAPNKVKVHHYNGIDSKFDPDTHLGLHDKSLKSMISFFSKFNKNFNLTEKDFTFIDRYPDTYKHNENVKTTPLSGDDIILVVDNTEPQKERFLKNILKYLQIRGIENKVVRDLSNMRSYYNSGKVKGVILTGSDYRINEVDDKLSRTAVKNFKCPIIGMCFGLQSMCKTYGAELVSGKKLVQDHRSLDKWKDCKIFKNCDLKNIKLSFAFHDYPKNCPDGFKVVGMVGDRIVAIANESKDQYGVLFHPEDTESGYKILDNFIGLCHKSQGEQEKLLQGKFESLISFDRFFPNN